MVWGRRSARGFTLIELMIVVAIVGILAAIAIPQYTAYIFRSKRSEAMGMLSSMKVAEETYRAVKDCYAPIARNPPGPAAPTRRTWDFARTTPSDRPCSDTSPRSFADLSVQPSGAQVYYAYGCTTQWAGSAPGATEEYACSMVGDLDGDGLESEIVYCTDNDASGSCIASINGNVSNFPYEPVRVNAPLW